MNGVIVTFILWLVTISQATFPPSKCKNSQYILNQSKLKYDVNQQWNQSELSMHIQEPRIGNPQRYSRVVLNNTNNYFEIERTYDEGNIKQSLGDDEDYQVLLDENSDVSAEIREKYRLSEERGEGYRNFYQTMYGLPMSITENFYTEIAPAEPITFEGKDAYRISLELNQEMISKHWRLIIATEDFTLLGVEFYHPENSNEGERIKFEDEVQLGNISLPRMRHWYDNKTEEYLGSDIIVSEISQDASTN
ncbi:MAG: DUF6503 family protein [Cyclobacteriaceae bacterium]